MFACISPYFQTAQFQSNVLIHLISYMMHVVALDLDKHRQESKKIFKTAILQSILNLRHAQCADTL